MDFEPEKHLGAVTRSVSDVERGGKAARVVTLSRTYDTNIDDLWDGVTNPERLPRWFAPVEGDFKVGGRFKITGNASGTILKCRAPEQLDLTWEFGPDLSWVDVRLAAVNDDVSQLMISHIAPVNEHWKKFGPGAAGVGWELGLMGMALYLEQMKSDPNAETVQMDENAFAASDGGRKLIKGSAHAWGEADIAAGANPDEAQAAASATGAFYTGEAPPED